MTRHDASHEVPRDARAPRLAARCAKLGPLVAVLALGLALSGCDRCGDFFWQKQPGSCKSGPAPN